MDLWGFNEAELIYCLVDTPFNLIEDEIRRADWKHNILTVDGEVKKDSQDFVIELVSKHIFTHEGLDSFCQQSSTVYREWFSDFVEIPKELRVKIFQVQKDQSMLDALYLQIKNCREYLNDLSLSVIPEFQKSA
jgi:hypothetical protein